MKTIEERAENYASMRHVLKNSLNWVAFYGFIAGAHSEREELLRWRNPEEELPDKGVSILIKVKDEGANELMYMGSYEGDGVFVAEGHVFNVEYTEVATLCHCKYKIGWRPIEEL